MNIGDIIRIWEQVLATIEIEISKANLTMWFRDTGVQKIEDGVVYLAVPSLFIQEWLTKKFHNQVLRAFRNQNSDIRALRYVITDSPTIKVSGQGSKAYVDKGVERKNIISPTISMPLEQLYVNKADNLNPRYTFESFVIGPFNQIAHAAAKAVLQNPGMVYNPLFIYGATGRGKTHLVQAIGNLFKTNNVNKKVFYLTSEKFGSECLTALQQGKANDFKDKYRKFDFLIMDDIQFFSEKEKFQEELFHLFNYFHNNNQQLIFSSDRHPSVIPGLEDRLRSRFNSGMIVDIPAPDLESRIEIVRRKSELANLLLDEMAINHIAEHMEGNIREIEGIINSLSCNVQVKKKQPSINDIKEILRNISRPKKSIPTKEVVKRIAEFYNLNEDSIYDKSRRKEVVRPRQVIMYILREDFSLSFPSIGERLGKRDHTTAIHSYEKVKNDIKTDTVLAEEVQQIRAML